MPALQARTAPTNKSHFHSATHTGHVAGLRRALLLDELDLVAVRVLDEGDHAAAVLHRAGLARHLAATCLDFLARFIGVLDRDRDVAEAAAEFVLFDAPVVGQFDDRAGGVVLVADERQRELALRVILAAQYPHAEHAGVERDRAFQIADPEHGVKYSHGSLPFRLFARRDPAFTSSGCYRLRYAVSLSRSSARRRG